jgi:hypothetical protein
MPTTSIELTGADGRLKRSAIGAILCGVEERCNGYDPPGST